MTPVWLVGSLGLGQVHYLPTSSPFAQEGATLGAAYGLVSTLLPGSGLFECGVSGHHWLVEETLEHETLQTGVTWPFLQSACSVCHTSCRQSVEHLL